MVVKEREKMAARRSNRFKGVCGEGSLEN